MLTSFSIASYARVHLPAPGVALARPAQPAGTPEVDWEARGAARRDLLGAVRALDALERILDSGRRGAVAPARAVSRSDLGLDPSPATAATLTSAAEVNATPTSFTAYAPSWAGGSSAAAVLDGEYDGSNGTQTLTFEVRQAGTHGADNLRVRIEDAGGRRIDEFNIRASHPPDRVYTASNGLRFTLGAGDLVNNDTFTVDVSASTGTAVDPDRPLDGTGLDDARLEYALPVGPGSFTVNGTTIDVFAGDSLNQVLARIGASGAGVSATFDAQTERVVLTQQTPGSAPGIVLGADSSGFLAATKLAAAPVAAGSDHQPSVALSSLAAFAAVSSGSVAVNGTAVAFDVNADSLLDVIARINASGAGVVATLSASAQRVTLESTDADRGFTLDAGGTALFAALDIAEGSYSAPRTHRRLTRAQSYRAADALESVHESLSRLAGPSAVAQVPGLGSLGASIRSILASTLRDEGERELVKLGVGIRATGNKDARLYLDAHSRSHFTHQLQRSVAPVQELMLGERGDAAGGLLGRLRGAVESAAVQLRSGDTLGAFVDVAA